MGFQERWGIYLGCASQATQNRSPVYELCWRLILGLLLPILGFDVHMDVDSDSLIDGGGLRAGVQQVQGVSVYLQHSTVDCRLGRRDLINSTDELIWV